jgi:hypothetical protein
MTTTVYKNKGKGARVLCQWESYDNKVEKSHVFCEQMQASHLR